MDGGGSARWTPFERATLADPGLQAAFDRDGYVRVPFLDPDRLAAVQAVFDELGRAPDDPGEAVHFGFFSQDAAWKREVREALRPIVAPVVEEHFAGHRLAYAMFITKWPGDRSAFGPHRDPWFVDETRFRSATLWCPLVDTPPATGPDNGSLHFVPGSHRLTDTPRIHDASKLLFEGAQDLILDEYGFPARLTAGQAVVFDNGMIHYSYRNASDAPRTVLALGLVPREADLYCLLPESASSIRVFAVDSDYFIEHNPFSMAYGLGHYPAVAQLEFEPPEVDEAGFRAWCDDAVARMDPDLRTGPLPRPTEDLSSDVFCFVCGGRDGLEDLPAPEHASVMVVCTRCGEDVVRRYSDRVLPTPSLDPGAIEPAPVAPRADVPADADAGPLEAALAVQGYAVVPAAGLPGVAALAAAAARLGDSEPIVAHAGPVGDGHGAPLSVAWSLVDEGAGEQAWLLCAPEASPVEAALVPGSHRVDPAPRGPGLAPAWTGDPGVLACTRTVTVAPGDVLVVHPALLHRPLTSLAVDGDPVVVGVAVAPGVHLVHLRGLPDGRIARYEIGRSWLAAAPLYGDAGLPPVCPVALLGPGPERPSADDVAAAVAPLRADAAAGGEAHPRRRRRWPLARRAPKRVGR